MAATDELVTILGVELSPGATAALKKFEAGMESVVGKLKRFAVMATAFGVGAGLFIKGAMDEAGALQTLSDKTGLSTDTLQEWSYAAKQAGVDANAVQGDLINLNKTMSSPIPGQFNMGLAMIGVSARKASGELKTSDEVLQDVGDRLAGMSRQRAIQWGSKIGLSDDTVVLLRQGGDALEKVRKEAHDLGAIIPSEAIKRSEEFRVALGKVQATLRSVSTQLAIAMMPALQHVLELFQGWLQRSREWIRLKTESFMLALVSALERFNGALQKLKDKFKPVIDAFDALTEGMDGTEVMIHLLTGGLALLATAFAPVLASMAVVAAKMIALSLIAEDLFAYFSGEEGTATGWFLDAFAEKFPGVIALFHTLKDAAKDLFENTLAKGKALVGPIAEAFTGAWGGIASLIDSVAGRLADFFGTFSERYPAVAKLLEKLAGLITDVLGGAITGVIDNVKSLSGIAEKVFGALMGLLEKTLGFINDILVKFGLVDEKTDDEAKRNRERAQAEREAEEVRKAALERSERTGTSLFDDVRERERNAPRGGARSVPQSAPILPDPLRYGDAPRSGEPGLTTTAALEAIERAGKMSAERTERVPAPRGAMQNVYDNRTTNISMSTSDPRQAAGMVLNAMGQSYETIVPGPYGPAHR